LKQEAGKQIIIAIVAAVFIFLIAILLPKLIFSNAVAKISATQILELALSILAILILGKGRFAEYGFRLPAPELTQSYRMARWLTYGIAALILGALATVALLVTGAAGNPIARQLTFPQIILFVWIFSSTIEEIFTRGFLQGHLSRFIETGRTISLLKVNIPALIGALFFSLMHLSLIASGVDLKTIIILLIFTFSVGLLAGKLRAETRSLIPAVGVHMLANIGGVIGGIVFSIISFIVTGKIPVR